MNTNYVIVNPTGNITALVTSPVADADKPAVVKEIFANEASCEQVGFVEVLDENTIRLEMMGGEFCGNATISVAAYFAETYHLPVYEDMTFNVISSGVDHPLSVRVLRKEDVDNGDHRYYTGTVQLPTPSLEQFHDYPIVHMNGISHMIIPSTDLQPDQAEALVKQYASELDILALGFILYDTESRESVRINPLVFVKGSDTLFWETGCATGSTAIAYYRYKNEGIRHTDVKQKGGIISIDFRNDSPYLTGGIIL